MSYYQEFNIAIYVNAKGYLPHSPEIWVPVPGYFGKYLMTWNGKFKSVNTSKLLTVRIDRGGYQTVRLSKNGATYTHFVHRLLALAFLPGGVSRPHINHKSGNKTDNRILNLEWTTHRENVLHAYRTGLADRTQQQKLVKDNCTGEKYNSVKEAAKATSIPYSTLKNYLNGTRPNKTCLEYAA